MVMSPRLLVLASSLVAVAAAAQPCTELPILFIVQDKSGSMAFNPSGTAATATNPSKWSIASQVVPQVAAQFGNRFRYGVLMYPGASYQFACDTGTVVRTVAATSTQVAGAYAATGPGGGTPTAASLREALAYLRTLPTTAPIHVLLITDGLPNCNTSLNAASCATTTPNCPNTNTCVPGTNCCGLGAKDCLDDTASVSAAAALRALNIKTYVVGFDQALTSGNNKAVLDSIAAAGGTTSAYVAGNQAALTAALNQIAQTTSTCCQNVCTQGAARCGGDGRREECRLDPVTQCTNWTSTACPPMSACTGGSCVSCTNQCTAGASQCTNGTERSCVVAANGCTEWQTVKTCAYGELCNGTQCGTCQACSIGAARCTATGIEECSWNVVSGCTQWMQRPCPSGTTCSNGACTSCNGTCTAGATRCAGRTVETCVADARGCTAWQTGQTCATFCSGGACGTCGTSCTPGATRCNGNGIETCGTDANACPVWGPAQRCPTNAFCDNGTCATCPTSCTGGARRCGANGALETCQVQTNGCSAWSPSGQCDVGGGERCDMGYCIPPCQNLCAAGARQCTGKNPQRCEVGPTGCTIWRDEPLCGMGDTCVAGSCLTPCGLDEFETCAAPGTVCVGMPEGKFCLPGMGGGPAGGGSAGGTSSSGGPGGGAAGGGAAGGPQAGGAVTGGGQGATAGGRPTGGSAGGGAAGVPTSGGAANPGGAGAGSNTVGVGSDSSQDRIGARGAGCGCTSMDGVAPLLLAAMLTLRRRARRNG